MSLSPGDSHHLAYSSLRIESNIERVAFDASTLTIGSNRQWLTSGSRYWGESLDLSADGKWLALGSGVTMPAFDIFVSASDGSGLHQVTNDGFSRLPDWMPDGRTEQFSVTLDGVFEPVSISPDGQVVAGHVTAQPGLVIMPLQTRAPEQITPSGQVPQWLPDGRRLLYRNGSELRAVDLRTKETRTVLSVAPDQLRAKSFSADGCWLYLARGAQHADIWMATLK